MENPPCDAFTSINQVVSQADMGKLNVTTFIGSCPQICALAWGMGNPDLSGVGTNISYILQAVLTVVFGPLLGLIYAVYRHKQDITKRLQDVQSDFHDISAQFSIPVTLAAIIRLRQKAPFYELAFLRSLTTMQFLSLLSSFLTYGIFKRKSWQRSLIVGLVYGGLDMILYFVLIAGLSPNQTNFRTLGDLGQACQAYSKIFPWIQHSPFPHFSDVKFKVDFKFKIDKGTIIQGLILLAFLLAFFLALALLAIIAFLLYKLLTGKYGQLVFGLMGLAFAIGMLVELAEMERTRNVMKEVTGKTFMDNQWGFGQIISLFVWIPFLLQVIYKMFAPLHWDDES